jgi:hypothetical protein
LCQVGNDHAFERWSHGRESITAQCLVEGRRPGPIRALSRSFDGFPVPLARIDFTPNGA